MSSYCSWYAQQCIELCCDRLGECPQFSGMECYHFYKEVGREVVPMMIGLGPNAYLIVLGCIVLLCISLLACCCCALNSKEEGLPDFGRSLGPVDVPPIYAQRRNV